MYVMRQTRFFKNRQNKRRGHRKIPNRRLPPAGIKHNGAVNIMVKPNITGLLIISGYIGKIHRGFNIQHAPYHDNCLFYANDANIRFLAMARGWKFIHLPKIPVMRNIIFNSVQSKKLKFLQINHLASDTTHVLWVDHKRRLSQDVAKRFFFTLKQSSQGILIRTTPSHKSSVWQELKCANNQNRYREFTQRTRQHIITETAKSGIQAWGLVANTGLILYDIKNDFSLKLANSVYNCIVKTGNPMCQIFWMIEAQKYPGLVKIVSYQNFRA